MFVNDQRKTILVRYGEIGLKGKNRSSFESALIRNMRSALEGVQGLKILREHGRIYVQYDDSTEKVAEKLSRVFGIVSLSPVITSRPDIEDIKRKALEGALKAGCRSGVSFKVETRRADKRFSITSPEVSRLAGGFILRIYRG